MVLQQVVRVAADGKIGPQTLAAVKAYPGGVVKLIRDYCAARMAFLRGLTNPKTGFPVNGRGWTIRVTGVDPKGQWASVPGVVGHAVEMAMTQGAVPVIDARPPAKPTPASSTGGAIAVIVAAIAAVAAYLGFGK